MLRSTHRVPHASTSTMKPSVQICFGLILLVSYTFASPRSNLSSKNARENADFLRDHPRSNHHKKQLDDELDLSDTLDGEDEQLPVLPPIILLDFVNGTEDGSNSTNNGDEKSKRTVDGSVGYGFDRNNLFTGKHHYYFPGGKAGTAVSIEESISPYEPQTVTEIVKPITEKQEEENDEVDHSTTAKPLFEALPDPLPLQNEDGNLPVYPPYPVFGQRTKLQKTESPNFEQMQKHYYGPYTAGSPDTYSKLLASYTSTKPSGQHTSSVNVNNYARPLTSSYLTNYMGNVHGNRYKQPHDLRPSSVATPLGNQELNLANYPKYTIENGIKYEHKIVWRYPDGKVSETPPASYNYQEHADEKPTGAYSGGFRPSPPFIPRPSVPQKNQNGVRTNYVPYTSNAQSNIHSQKPIQFPNDQEQPKDNQQKDPSRYIYQTSTSAPSSNQYDLPNYYNSGNYQGQYGLRQTAKPGSHRVVTNHKNQNNVHNYNSVPKYPVNSLDSEYPHPGDDRQPLNLFTSNGQLNKELLAKYTPEAQSYLMKVFSSGSNSLRNEYQHDGAGNNPNTDYSNLLNYSPSISQYIKNPSSILNAQPTFVQAGNSLIPVIILRVDGAPPVQSNSKTNINLKSLLRQYLTHYANSVSKVTENTNYDFSSSSGDGSVAASQPNPVKDLRYLTETLDSLRQRGHQSPDYLPASYSQKDTSQQSSSAGQDYSTNYNRFIKGYQNMHVTQQAINQRPKIKSVQIIEDPRYTSYKIEK